MTTDLGQFAINESHQLSLEILSMFEAQHTTVARGALACALSLGRLLASQETSPDSEIKFALDTVEWARTYWGAGDITH